MDEFLQRIEATISEWHGIRMPNEQAKRLLGELAEVIRGFERQRGTLRFEDEPSGFEAALQATKEGADKPRPKKKSAASKRTAKRGTSAKRGRR